MNLDPASWEHFLCLLTLDDVLFLYFAPQFLFISLHTHVFCARAMEYVCGTTLVVDTLAEARQLAFGDKERRKVVTIDGTLILKSGLMTGGIAHGGKAGLVERAKRWDQKQVEALKQRRDENVRRLADLGHQLRNFAREQQLAQLIAQLETHAKSLQAQLCDCPPFALCSTSLTSHII